MPVISTSDLALLRQQHKAKLVYMLPKVSVNDMGHKGQGYIKYFSKLFVCVFSRCIHGAYLSNLFLVKLGTTVFFPDGVIHSLLVRSWAKVFNIVNVIIGSVVIFVMNVITIWFFPQECTSNQRMDRGCFVCSIFVQSHDGVSVLVFALGEYFPREKAGTSQRVDDCSVKTFYPTLVANLIITLISWYISPFFHDVCSNENTPDSCPMCHQQACQGCSRFDYSLFNFSDNSPLVTT